MVTPEVIQTILKNADPMYRYNHELNSSHPVVGKCKLGAVFVNQAGNYCVYTGIAGRGKRPVAYTEAVSRKKFVAGQDLLQKIMKASEEML